ncbi:MAG: sigma-70 family RNA polymerase sigma factor [Desulfomonilaceae bacterium]|nr:sigma-70 family RNA polymerase sigma factor [Desulfomonilaceae bacterium]
MAQTCRSEDGLLVRECLSGSEDAWRELYAKYVFLMRSIVQRNPKLTAEDVEDITQTAFLSVCTSLESYDSTHPLSRFVCVITERVLVDEYRSRSAAKRNCGADPIDVTDPACDEQISMSADWELQDVRMEKAQQCSRLRKALRELDPRCRKLLELRYYNEIPFTEIAKTAGTSKNTLIVRARRCLEKLRAGFDVLGQRGLLR